MDSIQVSYALHSIMTTQLMIWHHYHLFHPHNEPKTGIIFSQIGAQPFTQKFECNIFHSSSLLKFVLCPQTQLQTVYKYVHLFLTPYFPLSIPRTLINQTQNCKILPFFLQNQYLNGHNILHKHVQKYV